MSWLWGSKQDVTEEKANKKGVTWKVGDDEDARIYNSLPSENEEPTTEQPRGLRRNTTRFQGANVFRPHVIIMTRPMQGPRTYSQAQRSGGGFSSGGGFGGGRFGGGGFGGGGAGSRAMVYTGQYDSGMCLAVISVFFCFPLGILAVFRSSMSSKAMTDGDFYLAERFSRDAKTYAIAAILIGVCVWWVIPYSVNRRRRRDIYIVHYQPRNATNTTTGGWQNTPFNDADQECLEPMLAYVSLAFSTLMACYY